MKHLILFLLLPFISLAKSNDTIHNSIELTFSFPMVQTEFNNISKSAYDNIRVNNVLLKNIKEFDDELIDIEALLGLPFSVLVPDPDARNFFNDNIKLAYGNATADWILYYIEILDSGIPLHILGKEVEIGDNISVLGLGANLKWHSTSLSRKSAVFRTEYEDSFIAIEFDVRSNLITKIEYISPT